MTRKPAALFTAVALVTLALGSSQLSAQRVVRDRIKPTAPTNLTVTATTSHSVSLSWGPSTDNSGQLVYLICCATTTVTVGQAVTSHTLEGLHSGATYTLRAYAKDAAGRAIGAFLNLQWDASTDDLSPQSFIRYDVYVNDELRAVVVGTAAAQVEVDYGVNNIAIIAVDTADNESAPGTITVIH